MLRKKKGKTMKKTKKMSKGGAKKMMYGGAMGKKTKKMSKCGAAKRK